MSETPYHRIEVDTDIVKHERGWVGAFTRRQHRDAKFPNGSRVSKVRSEPHDGTPNGTGGTVLGSLRKPGDPVLYFIEWDTARRSAVAVVDWKVGPEQ